MIFVCPDCKKQIDSTKMMRHCHPYAGHIPIVEVNDGTKHTFVEAKKPERQRAGYQSDFYLVGWGESQEPHSVRRGR